MSNNYFFEALEKSLSLPDQTEEGFIKLVGDTGFFFRVLKVKLESRDPELQAEAARELAELRSLLKKRINLLK